MNEIVPGGARMKSPTDMPTAESALPDRAEPVETDKFHFKNGNSLKGPFPSNSEMAMFAMGCFWGSEKAFWDLPGVWVTSVGFSGGFTANPTYQDVCNGVTGHAEVVRVVFDPRRISYGKLLKAFWEGHDPTQGMQQGEDIGHQYRSAIFFFNEAQRRSAERTRVAYQAELTRRGYSAITTEILSAGPFYFAEAKHQCYLAKEPHSYCDHSTGIICRLPPDVDVIAAGPDGTST